MTQPLPDPILGLDEAWAKADPLQAKLKGFHFVVGYISQDNTGKNLTRPEVDAIHAAGLDVALVFEYNPQSAVGGGWAGTQDGIVAVQKAQQLGAPKGMVIYFAIDFAVGTNSALASVGEYIHAAAVVCGAAGYLVGAYGGIVPIEWLLNGGFIKYAWQTYAWSNGNWDPRAVLRQVLNGVTVAGADVDKDLEIWPDFGQWRPDGSVGASTSPIGGSNMDWRDVLHSDANDATSPGRTAEDILVDLENERNWAYVTPGTAGLNDPPAGSRWDVMFRAAQAILAAPAPAPNSGTPTGPEQSLLDLLGRIASALDIIAASLAKSSQLTMATAPTVKLETDRGTLPYVPPLASMPTAQEAAVPPNGAPVDSQP